MSGYFNILKTFLQLIFFFASLGLKAQQPIPKYIVDSFHNNSTTTNNVCGNDIMLRRLRKDPGFKAKEDKMNKEILRVSRTLDDTITLPVVVHIINPNPYSITDLDIINGIKDLNDAFSKSGFYSASLGADTKIRFCLAQRDPDGGNTTGITRTTSFLTTHLNKDIEDDELKNLIQWNPVRYINIWFITSINAEEYANFACGNWYRLGVSGYGTMPPGGGSLDGIVVTGFGSLLAHEMGHYLSLYHTFEGSCNNYDCTLTGDRVCDTPPDGTVYPSLGCNFPDNTCNSDTLSNYSNGFFHTDVPDQISNFMDYGNNACSNQFTQGQADRMRAAIITFRSGLLQDECTKPCAENIIAGFTRNNPYPVPGDNISFTNTSTSTSNYQWLVNDIVVSTAANFSYTFNTIGKNKVTLKAFNNPGCFASYTDYIIVNCGVMARFYTNKQTIASKINIYTDSILFTNTSYNAKSYQWLISNDQGMTEQVVSTSTNLTYVFPTPGTYSIRLVAMNGSCSDTTETYNVQVLDPTPDGYPFTATLYCYQQNKVRIDFCIADFGYAPLPVNTPVNFYDADPRLPGAHKLSPAFYLTSPVPGGYCGYCFTHVLDVNYHGLEKIYLVFNDTGNSIPIVMPNASLVETNYLNNVYSSQPIKTVVDTFICHGQNYATHTTSGTYIDTLTSIINGCDSIRTLHLTVKPVFATTVDTSICQGQNYAGHLVSGTYIDIYSAVNGCDSIRTLHLTVKPASNTSISISICEGQNYYGYVKTGTYIDKFLMTNGCDSTRVLHLIVNPKELTTITTSICQGENYAGHVTSGTYVDVYQTIYGCDSTRTLYLTVKPIVSTNVAASICEGEDYAGHTQPGVYTDIYKSINGCDSTRTLTLTVNPKKVTTINASICKGESYLAAGNLQTKEGVYFDTLRTYLNCDSIIITNLTVHSLPSPDLGADRGVCIGSVLVLNPGNFANYLWQDGSTKPSFTTNLVDTYWVAVTDPLGCKNSDTMKLVTIYPLPADFLPPDSSLCERNVLRIKIPGYINYNWSIGSNLNFIDITQTGTYRLQVTDKYNCKGIDSMNVLFYQCVAIQIPNAFTPNADGKNDLFRPLIPAPLADYHMQIWNRWGQLLFETREIGKGWDGTFHLKKQPQAVYVYFVKYTDKDGKEVRKSGTCVLIR